MKLHRIILPVLALSALFAALPANACQLVCMLTTAKYAGNIGGVSAADAICAGEFGTGFKFARSTGFVDNLNGEPVSVGGANSTNRRWVASSPGATSNCSNWSSNSSGITGPAVYAIFYDSITLGPGLWLGSASACNNQQPLMCCNM